MQIYDDFEGIPAYKSALFRLVMTHDLFIQPFFIQPLKSTPWNKGI